MARVKPFAEGQQFIPIPQVLVDEVMPNMSPSAWKVFTFIFRKTAGWRKARDSIAYSQIVNGAGIKSPNAISAALHELQGEVPILEGRRVLDWVRVPAMPVLVVARKGVRVNGKTETTSYALNLELEIEPTMKNIEGDETNYEFHRDNKQSPFSNSERDNLTVEGISNSKRRSRDGPNEETMPQPTFPTADEIKRDADLAEVVSRYVDLKPGGKGKLRGCCPFHDERSPSFYVYSDQRYKCFGCGASGDVFQFVQGVEHVDFVGAKKLLSNQPQDVTPRPSFRGQPREVEHEDWREVLSQSGPSSLEGSPGWKYLVNTRGLSPETIAAGNLQFARSWKRRASVIFPIYGEDGSTVALQGRAIAGAAKITIGPKDSGLFATVGAFEAENVAVCEGPIDALSFLQIFDVPAVAVCGASDIPEWFLKRLKGDLLIASDNDPPKTKGPMKGKRPGEICAQRWKAQADALGVPTRRICPTGKDWNVDLISGTMTT